MYLIWLSIIFEIVVLMVCCFDWIINFDKVKVYILLWFWLEKVILL